MIPVPELLAFAEKPWIFNLCYLFEKKDSAIEIDKNDYWDGKGPFICTSYRFPVKRSRNYDEFMPSDTVAALKNLIDEGYILTAAYKVDVRKLVITAYEETAFKCFLYENGKAENVNIAYDKIVDSVREEVWGRPDGRIEFYGFRLSRFHSEEVSLPLFKTQLEKLVSEDPGQELSIAAIQLDLEALFSTSMIVEYRKSITSIYLHLDFMRQRLAYTGRTSGFDFSEIDIPRVMTMFESLKDTPDYGAIRTACSKWKSEYCSILETVRSRI